MKQPPRRAAVTSTTWRSLGLAGAVALVEALDTATGINQLLLAGVEGVALVAKLDVLLARLGGAGGERVAARALDGHFVVLGMDVGLHVAPQRNGNVAVYRRKGPDGWGQAPSVPRRDRCLRSV